MTGFEVKFRDQVINAAIPDGSNSIIIGKRDNIFYLDIGGMDKETQNFHRWYYAEDVTLGENIVIAIKDVEQISRLMDKEQYEPFFSKRSEQQTVGEIDAINQKRLAYFMPWKMSFNMKMDTLKKKVLLR